MKYPDALRVICQAIVEKHLPREKVAFDVAGEQLLDEAEQASDPAELVRAEFGASTSDDLHIVGVAQALKKTTDLCIRSKKPVSLDEVVRYWTNNMCKFGLDEGLAGEIASQFGADAHQFIVAQRGS